MKIVLSPLEQAEQVRQSRADLCPFEDHGRWFVRSRDFARTGVEYELTYEVVGDGSVDVLCCCPSFRACWHAHLFARMVVRPLFPGLAIFSLGVDRRDPLLPGEEVVDEFEAFSLA